MTKKAGAMTVQTSLFYISVSADILVHTLCLFCICIWFLEMTIPYKKILSSKFESFSQSQCFLLTKRKYQLQWIIISTFLLLVLVSDMFRFRSITSLDTFKKFLKVFFRIVGTGTVLSVLDNFSMWFNILFFEEQSNENFPF